jgi:hypothetical protein
VKTKLHLILLFVIILGAINIVQAQEESTKDITLESLKNLLIDSMIIENTFSELFNEPETILTLNKIWKENVIHESRFLRELNLEFKTFKVSNSDSITGLGVGYSFSKDITRRRFGNESQTGISLSLHTQGNIAFEKNINPEDFLESSLSFHLFKSWGGTIAATPEVWTKLNELEDSLALIENSEELINSPVLKEFISVTKKYLADQYYLDFSLLGNYESNQDFSIKQYSYGVDLGFDCKLWKNEFFNIFDYPFAAIRWLSGYDEELNPMGVSFPAFIISLEQVNPIQFESREVLDESDDYSRLSGELSFKTPLSGSSYFEADLKYYKEINPPDKIKEANLDECIYFKAAITTAEGIFISYANGKLPFDLLDNEIYQLGFKYNFN